MAIYHASFQVIKRSAGRSAIAAAAYRSGEKLIDDTTNQIHDYSRKKGVASSFIMKPEGSPAWAGDRQLLWSTVERVERRRDAQLCRELNVALPVELNVAESEKLLKDYVQASFVDNGMVADVAMHDMKKPTDDSKAYNPHAHVMLSLRSIDGDGFGNKNRDWNDRERMTEWREGWAKAVNEHLEKAGHESRVDHRSLSAQGVDREPTIHLGPHVHAMNERGIKTDRGAYLDRINDHNEHRSHQREQPKRYDHEAATTERGADLVAVRDQMDEAIARMEAPQAVAVQAAEALESDSVERLQSGSEGSALLDDVKKVRSRKAAPAPVRGGGGGKSGMDLEILKDELVGPEERKRRRAMRRNKGIDI